MLFEAQSIAGVYIVRAQVWSDERGDFFRTYCRKAFADIGLDFQVVQSSLSVTKERGTLRGMHFQSAPHGEDKLVRCLRGAIWDVVADLRPQSSTYGQWCAFELNSSEHLALHVPKGVAHGFLTLQPQTEVLYMMAQEYVHEAASGVRWDDPNLGIDWPEQPKLISSRDANLPFLSEL